MGDDKDVGKSIKLLTIMLTIFFTSWHNYFNIFFFFFDSSSSCSSLNTISFFLTTDVCLLLHQGSPVFNMFRATLAKFDLHASNIKFNMQNVKKALIHAYLAAIVILYITLNKNVQIIK